jgi:ABC-type branched-subunit amino acid transport system ATPase component
MLTISNLQVFYDRAVDALRDVSLEVRAGQIVALLGSNGAGKSTVLKSICGVLYPEDGEIVGGNISYQGTALAGIRRCGANVMRVCVVSELIKLKNFNTGGLTGPVSFDNPKAQAVLPIECSRPIRRIRP